MSVRGWRPQQRDCSGSERVARGRPPGPPQTLAEGWRCPPSSGETEAVGWQPEAWDLPLRQTYLALLLFSDSCLASGGPRACEPALHSRTSRPGPQIRFSVPSLHTSNSKRCPQTRPLATSTPIPQALQSPLNFTCSDRMRPVRAQSPLETRCK